MGGVRIDSRAARAAMNCGCAGSRGRRAEHLNRAVRARREARDGAIKRTVCPASLRRRTQQCPSLRLGSYGTVSIVFSARAEPEPGRNEKGPAHCAGPEFRAGCAAGSTVDDVRRVERSRDAGAGIIKMCLGVRVGRAFQSGLGECVNALEFCPRERRNRTQRRTARIL